MRPSATSKFAFNSLNSVSFAVNVSGYFWRSDRIDDIRKAGHSGDPGERAVGDIEIEQCALQHFRVPLAAQCRLDLLPILTAAGKFHVRVHLPTDISFRFRMSACIEILNVDSLDFEAMEKRGTASLKEYSPSACTAPLSVFVTRRLRILATLSAKETVASRPLYGTLFKACRPRS